MNIDYTWLCRMKRENWQAVEENNIYIWRKERLNKHEANCEWE